MTDPITRLNAALEGRYVIERELGEGGMATVYLADDFEGSDGTVTVPYDVFPDDQSFVMARIYRPEGEETVEPELILVQNWLEELKARVPN
jgi:serine/threonine protein kinase